MRIESSVTSISWIPSEAIVGMTRLPFELGVGHYDEAPPERIEPAQLEDMRDDDRFRFANHLAVWMEVDGGRVTDHGFGGGGVVNNTNMRVGPLGFTFQATAFPELRPDPEVTEASVTVRQSAGGRPGMPTPRWVSSRRRVQLVAPTVWTTVQLTLHSNGRVEPRLAGASPFPRHWLYDGEGTLVQKSGTIDFGSWYDRPAGASGTPWGDQDSTVFVTMAESSLERELSSAIMRRGKPRILVLDAGAELTRQGERGKEIYLVLDGILTVDVDGRELAELGPGAVVGERAVLEGGRRTATLRAVTRLKVASVPADAVDRNALDALTGLHHRED